MKVLTYSAEVQQAARETLQALEEVMLDELQDRIDQEGCGAFMCACVYQNEIESMEGKE